MESEIYEDMTEEEIAKGKQKVSYVLYFAATGEVYQSGTTDMLSYEKMEPPREGLEKAIIPTGEEWMLRGEFVDHDDTQRPMFKIEEGGLVAKEAHVEKITDMRMPRDGARKVPIEAEGPGGKEIIAMDIVQDPIKVEKGISRQDKK